MEDFYIPIVRTFGYDHFSKFHDSHYGKLFRAYGAHHRAYHNRGHVRKVAWEAGFRAGAAWWNVKKVQDDDVRKVVLAAYYHDLYPNVRKSARFARRQVEEMGFSQDYSSFVFDSIRATRLHVTEDPLMQILIDADLEVLTSRFKRDYIKYMLNIRLEYPNVSDIDYANERGKVLKHYRKVINYGGDKERVSRAVDNIIFEQNILYRFKGLHSRKDHFLQPRSLITLYTELDNLVNHEYFHTLNIVRTDGFYVKRF